MIYIEKIISGKWKENCYILYDNIRKDALVIDPGSDADLIISFIKQSELNVIAILNTHGHYDHVGAVHNLKEEFNVPFFLHSNDQRLLNHANLYLKLFHGSTLIQIPKVDYYFDQIIMPVQIKDFSIQILFTPGHTKGSVCLKIEDYLFTGDTILKGEIGRIDLPGGNEFLLKKSLNMISKLPENTLIYPGHGESSILIVELQHNMRFIETSEWE